MKGEKSKGAEIAEIGCATVLHRCRASSYSELKTDSWFIFIAEQ